MAHPQGSPGGVKSKQSVEVVTVVPASPAVRDVNKVRDSGWMGTGTGLRDSAGMYA